MWGWQSARRLAALVWGIWLLALFGSYFYHMLTLPERWDKIVDFLQKLSP